VAASSKTSLERTRRLAQSLGAKEPNNPLETYMKLMVTLILLLSVSACAVAPADSGGKAGGDTAVVCHKGKKTLELPRDAAKAHLDHGDRVGPC
jgi:hypothetical protein